jgi:GDP-D-mannose dehydratase
MWLMLQHDTPEDFVIATGKIFLLDFVNNKFYGFR